MSPVPSSPYVLSPQHQAAPSAVRPQTLQKLATSEANRTPVFTAVAPVLRTVSPTPSCPWVLIPQQYAAPPESSPQPNLAPTVIDLNGCGAETDAGTVR